MSRIYWFTKQQLGEYRGKCVWKAALNDWYGWFRAGKPIRVWLSQTGKEMNKEAAGIDKNKALIHPAIPWCLLSQAGPPSRNSWGHKYWSLRDFCTEGNNYIRCVMWCYAARYIKVWPTLSPLPILISSSRNVVSTQPYIEIIIMDICWFFQELWLTVGLLILTRLQYKP